MALISQRFFIFLLPRGSLYSPLFLQASLKLPANSEAFWLTQKRAPFSSLSPNLFHTAMHKVEKSWRAWSLHTFTDKSSEAFLFYDKLSWPRFDRAPCRFVSPSYFTPRRIHTPVSFIGTAKNRGWGRGKRSSRKKCTEIAIYCPPHCVVAYGVASLILWTLNYFWSLGKSLSPLCRLSVLF